MNTPDTTEAVLEALRYNPSEDLIPETLTIAQLRFISATAIHAHNKALAEMVPEDTLIDLIDHMRDEGYEFIAGRVSGFNEARRLFLGEEA